MSCSLSVKVVPGASRDEIVGRLGNGARACLKIRIQAPPTGGQANERLCAFLSKILNLPRRAVTVASGASSARKILHIEGLPLEEVNAKLEQKS
jgi:uncharacterized protein (TIGR00251 family)